MRGLSSAPSLRRVLLSAAAAMAIGLGAVSVVVGFSESFPVKLLQGVAVFAAGAVILGGVVLFALVHLAGWREPESEAEFDEIVERAERLAAEGRWGDSHESDDDDEFELTTDEDFRALVRSAIDELPLEFHRALEHVAVVVSDEGGRRQRAYGLYQGDTVARDYFHDRIVIFRDTLMRDFGHDPELLKAQVTRTVRHELAHHLGWGEKGVRGLGL
jgi:predicted Zn-dependent protease with MMP-like domain